MDYIQRRNSNNGKETWYLISSDAMLVNIAASYRNIYKMKKYHSEILLEKYCPTIYNFTKKAKINWKEIDFKFEQDCLKIGVDIEANIFGILLYAESGEEYSLSFVRFCEFLAKSLETLTIEKNKFRKLIIGKITNFKDLNYLNPIGELSVLKTLTNQGYKLVRIEDKQFFPKAKPKDFLFKSPKGSNVLIEVVNIHLKKVFENLDDLKKFLFEKVLEKVKEETKGISPNDEKNILFFQPVLWHVEFKKFRQFASFFKNFSLTTGKEIGLDYKILGFCTFGTINKTDFIFGELSTFYEKYEI